MSLNIVRSSINTKVFFSASKIIYIYTYYYDDNVVTPAGSTQNHYIAWVLGGKTEKHGKVEVERKN